MSEIKLFRIQRETAIQLESRAAHLEKPLQTLIEKNLETLLAARFVTSEHSTGNRHGGRIDTLGLDENGYPLVIEYKRSLNENVITQGLYYLDWLMDHRGEFELLVQKTLGTEASESIDWTEPRLVCIAGEFTKFDAYAVEQIDRSIDLIRYRRFGEDLLLFELVNGASSDVPVELSHTAQSSASPRRAKDTKPRPRWLPDLAPEQRELFEALESYILSLGDDIQRRDQKLYIAYRRLRNFATVVAQKSRLHLFLHLNPRSVNFVDGFTRDVSSIGHWGTGDVELTLATFQDLENAKPLIAQSYAPDAQ